MKLGAADYLLKPFDSGTLAVTLEGILQRRRLRAEHDRLLSENLEYVAETSLLERALSLFGTLGVEPLATRIVEELCRETGAQGGVLWIADEDDPERLELAAARGLVRTSEERRVLGPDDVPEPLREEATSAACVPWTAGDGPSQPALFVALRRQGQLLGVVRLTDKLEGDSFDPVDREAAARLASHGRAALANALHVRGLERRSFDDSATGVYRQGFFENLIRNETQRANRFGRGFALLRVDPGPLEGIPGSRDEFLAGFARVLAGGLRSSDQLGVDARRRFTVLLAEVDGIGAAVLKRRCLEALENSELLRDLDPALRPSPRLATVVYPADGSQVEVLLRTLGRRSRAGQRSLLQRLGLERAGLADSLAMLLDEGSDERAETAQQIARFVLAQAAWRPRERTVSYSAPSGVLGEATCQGLEALRGVATRAEVVVVDGSGRRFADVPCVTWVAAERTGELTPCLVHYGDRAAYALVCAPGDVPGPGSPLRMFHTDDREIVEHLVFGLQAEIAVPGALWPASPEGAQ
jgi:GGDEF domain-containing protein